VAQTFSGIGKGFPNIGRGVSNMGRRLSRIKKRLKRPGFRLIVVVAKNLLGKNVVRTNEIKKERQTL
jgi:hypothetical protein